MDCDSDCGTSGIELFSCRSASETNTPFPLRSRNILKDRWTRSHLIVIVVQSASRYFHSLLASGKMCEVQSASLPEVRILNYEFSLLPMQVLKTFYLPTDLQTFLSILPDLCIMLNN